MIRLINVWKAYGAIAALRNVSLSIEPGEATLLTGPSGAGKSTLLRLLFAAERADQGQVLVADRDVGKLRRASIPYLRRNVGVVFQDFKLLRDRTVRENVGLALEILGLAGPEVRRRTDAALASVGLAGKERLRVGQLSGGEQQRVAVARAVVARPAILLADEPTGNLDPRHADELLVHFETLRRGGMTMLIATHDPDVMRFGTAHAWRQLRLDAGVLVDGIPAEQLLHEPTKPSSAHRLDDEDLEIVEPSPASAEPRASLRVVS